ncbi:MAG: peptidoglycan DD-metalloendopeptidase family protein [Actinobacteria bacterium]|nr:peptidoglycan DD-metalloendopeptidase family protein [Actinomycetota bacterium]
MATAAAHGRGMRTSIRTVLSLLTVVAVVTTPAVATARPTLPTAVRPVPGLVLTRFDPSDPVWAAGHRGVDLAGRAGETVVAAADGNVSFADVLAGRGVVVVDHGTVRTTYEPVTATVQVGEAVGRGRPIGRLQAGHGSCPATTCLHWGLREGDAYLDPLLLVSGGIRLLPASATPRALEGAAPEQDLAAVHALTRPAAGPVSSPYGMRRHPLTGVWKLHDGTDIAAACGSSIRAAGAGTVVGVSVTSAYGNRLVLDHGTTSSGRLLTAYSHAGGFAVAVGDHVSASQVIGAVGSTGLTTGCHLHLQAWLDGRLVDPMTVIS